MVSCFIVINVTIVIVGAVPVIAVLTRADALKCEAIGQLRDKGVQMKEAISRAGELTEQILNDVRANIESQLSGCKYPPKAYIAMAGKYSLPFVFGLNYKLHTPQVCIERVQIALHF